MEKVNVLAAFDWLVGEEKIGVLGYESLRGSDVFTFEYDKKWLEKHSNIFLSSDLMPFSGVQYSKDNKIFRCFSDSLPDRWGRKLIEIRSTLAERTMKGRQRLTDWDYLKGVEDFLRMGAFRFQDIHTGKFIRESTHLTIPPIMDIRELLDASVEVEKSELNHVTPEEKWIYRLFNPGTSMGGARPKACVKKDAEVYLAKFPSIRDEYDISAWENFAHLMAKDCGIDVADTELIEGNNRGHILLSKRFDRKADGSRVHMASSLTLLGLQDGAGQRTGNGYLDIVDFLVSNGGNNVDDCLEELYRRIAFNICIGNTDDHFRNHSFLLTKDGWNLAPAYDLNPTNAWYQSLLINESSSDSDLDELYDSHEDYMLDEKTAYGIIKDVTNNVKYWKSIAFKAGVPKNELGIFSNRIDEGIQWRYGGGLHR